MPPDCRFGQLTAPLRARLGAPRKNRPQASTQTSSKGLWPSTPSVVRCVPATDWAESRRSRSPHIPRAMGFFESSGLMSFRKEYMRLHGQIASLQYENSRYSA